MRSLRLILVSIIIVTLWAPQVYALDFPDVPESHPNYQAINKLVTDNIVRGYPDGTFRPNRTVSRVELLKMAIIGLGIPVETSKEKPFPDLADNAWYTPFINKARSLKAIRGYQDGTFKPDKIVSKIEALKILLVLKNANLPIVQENLFLDATKDDWFTPYIKYVLDRGLIDHAGRTFDINDGMTRKDVAELIFRIKYLQENSMPFYPYANVVMEYSRPTSVIKPDVATFFSDIYQGTRTASGEILDNNKFSASHGSLPFGTLVKVINRSNNKHVLVHINGRGPFPNGASISLTRRAYKLLTSSDASTIDVRLEVLEQPRTETKKAVITRRPATISKIVDGDTVTTSEGEIIRIIGIDTPERGHPFFSDATRFTKEKLFNTNVTLHICVKRPIDKYGRTLASIELKDGRDFGKLVLDTGLALYFDDAKCSSQISKEYADAEIAARDQRIGEFIDADQNKDVSITFINSDPPGNDNLVLNQEWVLLSNNTTGPINILDYTIEDSLGKTFTFPRITITPGNFIKLHTGTATDTKTDIYWNSTHPIWNNNGDEATLKNKSGNIVSIYKYR